MHPADHKDYQRWIDSGMALIGVIIILCILFAGGEIGLSDQGDFSRVMKGSSLQFTVADRAFTYVGDYTIRITGRSFLDNVRIILFSPVGIDSYPNIQLLLVRLTVVGNLFWNGLTGHAPEHYRLWTLAAVYALLYGLALYALFRSIRLKNPALDIAAKAFALLVLCDIGYVCYFGSFYSEPLQMIGLILSAAFGLRLADDSRPLSGGTAVGACLSAVLYGWSKFANIPVGLLMIAAFVFLAAARGRKWLALSAGALSAAVLIAVFLSLPAWMSGDTDFNAVFYGVVKDTDRATSEEYLVDLGLDPAMADFAGNHAYVSGVRTRFSEAGYAQQFSQLGKTALLRFYLSHPGYYAGKLRLSLESSGMLRPFYLSNYDAASPRFTLSERFSLWSRIRPALDFGGVFGNLAILAGELALLAVTLRKNKKTLIAALLLCLGAWGYQLAIPYVTNGEADLAKHMFALAQIADLMVLHLTLAALNALPERRASVRALLAPAVAVCLLAAPVRSALRAGALERTAHTTLEPGAYVLLGSRDGKPIEWLVAQTEGSTAALLCADILDTRVFDSGNSNQWASSELRSWLNGAFLADCFGSNERSLLRETRHMALLSAADKENATAGDHEFYCTHLIRYVGVGFDRAYRVELTDRAALPDAKLIMTLAQKGWRLTSDHSYWLMTPYFSNGSMFRCVYPDGNVYFQDAKEARGVRPVIFIDLDAARQRLESGSGSLADPLRIA